MNCALHRNVQTTRMESTANIKERRQTIRLPMALPVELEEGSGVTRDVSLSGIFFETSHSLPSMEPISFTLVFEGRSWRRPIRLSCEGQVVRVQPSNGKLGVAMTISSYRFAPDHVLSNEEQHPSTESVASPANPVPE